MNNLFNKLERKFGKYAIPHLTFVMIGCYVVGYLLQAVNPEFPAAFLSLDISQILRGQIWRLFTWILIPPSSLDVFTLIRYAVSAHQILYWINVIAICASLANFLIFFLSGRRGSRLTREQRRMRRSFRDAQRAARGARPRTVDGTAREADVEKIRPYRHRCEVCGRTDVSDPDLEFRYCSKCDGAHEYCMDHLYTHTHVKGPHSADEGGH